MKEYDQASYDLLKSFKDWADAYFGSAKMCFNALDEDSDGSITLREMKRQCKRYKWDGDVRVLFESLDVSLRNKHHADAGDNAIELNEMVFLDNWKAQSTEEEVKAEIRALQSGRLSVFDK